MKTSWETTTYHHTQKRERHTHIWCNHGFWYMGFYLKPLEALLWTFWSFWRGLLTTLGLLPCNAEHSIPLHWSQCITVADWRIPDPCTEEPSTTTCTKFYSSTWLDLDCNSFLSEGLMASSSSGNPWCWSSYSSEATHTYRVSISNTHQELLPELLLSMVQLHDIFLHQVGIDGLELSLPFSVELLLPNTK